MAKSFLILLLFAFVAFGQEEQKRVAILNTEGPDDLTYLSVRLREIAVKVLPKDKYSIMTAETIIDKLGSKENARKVCREAQCLAEIGRKVSAAYVGQARVGSFGGNFTISMELYNAASGTLVDSFTGDAKDVFGLLAVINEKAPQMFGKMPGVSSRPIIEGGIGGVQIKGDDYEFAGGKRYVASISSDPEGAGLSFNGLPLSSCKETPCKVELQEGSVRIIANLEQYEIADTTVSIKQNNQSIRIRMKANFGVLEIKPAYSNDIGKNEQWSLSINGKTFSSFENRLSPNKYSVELSHRCYEAINFEAGINKGKREVFDMASHIKLKKGGLVLSTETDDEPVSEPVFVNGVQVGETPFSGSVPLCAKIEIGTGREEVSVQIKPNKSVTYTHKMNTEEWWQRKRRLELQARQEVELKRLEQKRKEQKLEVEQQLRQEAEQKLAVEQQARQKAEQDIERSKRTIRLGARWRGGFRWLADELHSGYLTPGLTLNIRIIDMINLASELNYSLVFYHHVYQTIEVPALLRLQLPEGLGYKYAEAGFQWGFPVSYKATRVERDKGLVFGFGLRAFDFSIGMRLTYPLTKLDKDGNINAPIIVSILTLAYDFF